MATNMAPHNLVEVIAAARHLIDHPDATLEDIMKFVAAEIEEMLSCARPDGSRLALSARTVRDELKRTCENEGLP